MYVCYFKRIIDFVLVFFIGIFSFPLMLGIIIINFFFYGRHIFYVHSRIGYQGSLINVYKFRTMYLNSESILESYFIKNSDAKRIWEEKHKLYNDPRITKFGKFLRKFSLDELPQIFNVLNGNMSLVGPRPIVSDEIKKYGSSFSFYKKIKPGITGLWQVSGRNDLSYDKRVQLDVFYIQNISFFMDLFILLKTFPVIFFKKGAY